LGGTRSPPFDFNGWISTSPKVEEVEDDEEEEEEEVYWWSSISVSLL